MVSSVGSGSVLFTPRVGSRYGYELLWVLIIVITLMWVMIREVGRYTVVTGRTILEGFREVPGPRGWTIWIVLVPGLAAGATVIAGVAVLAGSAVALVIPGDPVLYGCLIIMLSGTIVFLGHYSGVERIAAVLSVVLIVSVVATAIIVTPDPAAFSAGLVPGLPAEPDWYFILPWVGFILAGAGGILWFSYWTAARGFGGAVGDDSAAPRRMDAAGIDADLVDRLRRWNRMMSNAALIGVVTGGVVIGSFLVLGAELLRPEGIVPQGITVAEDLARLLSEVWGEAGRWVLIVSVVVALWGTVISNQDGWPRTFVDSVLLLQRERPLDDDDRDEPRARWRARLRDRTFVHRAALVVTVTAAPLAVALIVRDPVDILSVGGIVTAALTPPLVVLTLYVNLRDLPPVLRPGRVMRIGMVLAALFFTAFAVLYFADLFGLQLL